MCVCLCVCATSEFSWISKLNLTRVYPWVCRILGLSSSSLRLHTVGWERRGPLCVRGERGGEVVLMVGVRFILRCIVGQHIFIFTQYVLIRHHNPKIFKWFNFICSTNVILKPTTLFGKSPYQGHAVLWPLTGREKLFTWSRVYS